jgi:hypothetical protein
VLTKKVGHEGSAVAVQERRPDVGHGAVGIGPHEDEAAVAQRGDIGIGFQPRAIRPDQSDGTCQYRAGRTDDGKPDVLIRLAAANLVLIDRHEVAVRQRRELGAIPRVALIVDIELGAHRPGGAHDAPDDIGVGPGLEGIGDGVAAAGKRGDGRVVRFVREDVDMVDPDHRQRGIKDAHPDVVVAGEQIAERDRDVAVVQQRDRRRGLVA